MYLFTAHIVSFSLFPAIQYNIPAEHIPNPQYRCTSHECPWNQYKEEIDWGFYKEDGEHIDNCRLCMTRCDDDPACGSVECGENQNLPDGTVVKAHCSWWRKGKCETGPEFSTNPNNLILTCKKQRKFLYSNTRNITFMSR